MEVVASIQQSKLGLHDWSLSDLTIGLLLIYLQQASKNSVEDVKGVQILSDSIVSTGTLYFGNLIAETRDIFESLFPLHLHSTYSVNFSSLILFCLVP